MTNERPEHAGVPFPPPLIYVSGILIIPNRPATAFVSSGPYRWTRNPMYVSLALLYLAVALWMNSWWAVLMLIAVLFIIQATVITREERYLGAAFPDQYAEYRARTGRWI